MTEQDLALTPSPALPSGHAGTFQDDGAQPAVPAAGPRSGAPSRRRPRREHLVSAIRRLRPALRQPGLVLSVAWIIALVLAIVLPDVVSPSEPTRATARRRLAPPGPDHLFGTDQLGRDLFSRMVHGASLSLRTAVLSVLVGLVIGAFLGLLAGFLQGWVDVVIMRVMDVLLAVPSLLLALTLIAVLGGGSINIAVAVGVSGIAVCARTMRAEVIHVRQSVFIEASFVCGARRSAVLRRHVLPNSAGPVVVLAALQFGPAILAVSALSFLGFGARPPTPEWGSMVAGGRDFLATAWWLSTMPGLTILLTVLAGNRVARALNGR
ncbi:ABC transporter permease [Frankia sp. QA3]|uniref:ABC transporter permease n=1 Tax=Frankia sp. QA3 TaxID=710111 RepID=UPI0002F78C4E|nr:ABC transporter permease [Frankia sp. QA3]